MSTLQVTDAAARGLGATATHDEPGPAAARVQYDTPMPLDPILMRRLAFARYLFRTGSRGPRVAIARAILLATTLLASLALAAPVGACPDCAVGRQARAQVWTDDFGANMFVALAPFLIIGAVSVWVNRIGGRPNGTEGERRDHP